MPPVSSGVADYTRDLVGELGRRHAIDVFVDARDLAVPPSDGTARHLSAHEFPWRQHRDPYDLVVYQVGNSWCHDFTWPYLFRYPGLVVLHDGQLHHARAWSLLQRKRTDDYRAELHFNHPDVPPEAAEIALSGYAGHVYRLWPMLGAVVKAARLVAVHSARLADELSSTFPAMAIRPIRMGVPAVDASDAARAAVRARHGLAPTDIVLAAFGGVTPEKGLTALLRAVSGARRHQPGLRVLLVGPTHPHYDVMAHAREVGVADIVTVTGHVSDAELPAYLTTADIVSCLRFPSGRETSASWLRALAAGRPTLVTDLEQHVDVPMLDPRDWEVRAASGLQQSQAPVAVAIDLLDEVHSLGLAVRRLAADPSLRGSLGDAARRFWERSHRVTDMADDYERVMAEAASRPDPDVTLPRHLRPDSFAHTRQLLAPFGLGVPDLSA